MCDDDDALLYSLVTTTTSVVQCSRIVSDKEEVLKNTNLFVVDSDSIEEIKHLNQSNE